MVMDEKRALDVMDELLSGACHIMGVLPERVPEARKDEYLKFESHMLENFDGYRLAERFSEAILKLMCYYRSTMLYGKYSESPTPDDVEFAVEDIMANRSGSLVIFLGVTDKTAEAMITFEWDCFYMALYGGDEHMHTLAEAIAHSAGLYLRAGAEDDCDIILM